jgi:nicotinamidase-related amidase
VRPDLAELAAPAHTAVVTQECQGAVMGPNAGLAVLAAEARREALPNIVRLVPAALAAAVRVVHCLVQRRADGLGSNHNARLFAGAGKRAGKGLDITPGSVGATLLPELGPEDGDLVLSRWHGLGPMGGTDLDPILRNLGVSTIVAVGVSLNVAIPNLVMDAVNKGYRVVLPRDAVAGFPAEYGTRRPSWNGSPRQYAACRTWPCRPIRTARHGPPPPRRSRMPARQSKRIRYPTARRPQVAPPSSPDSATP